MNPFQTNILHWIHAALTAQAGAVDPKQDWEHILAYGIKQKVLPLLYYGIRNTGLAIPQPYASRFLAATAKFAMQSDEQLKELQTVRAAFDSRNIRYIVLKGAELKQYYPKPELRPMGDVDILVDMTRYEEIRAIMQELGYTQGPESDHELIWTKGSCMIELHKRLIPSYNRDYYPYFGEGWARACPVSEQANVYRFSPEDNFIFLFTHFAKHYRDAGIGVLHLVDLYVFRNTYPLEEAYLQKEFRKLGLWEFYGNMVKTLEVCFRGAEPTPVVTHIIDRIFGAGAYGSQKDRAVSAAVKRTKRIKNNKHIPLVLLWKKAFAPYEQMCIKHKVLIKAPILLPFFWVYRGVSVFFFHREKVRKEIGKIKLADGQTIQQYQKDLQYVGLDFHFEE